MAMISFDSDEQLARWKGTEPSSLVSAIETVPVDLARQSESKPECRGHDGRAAGVPSCPRAEPGVYLIIPYEVTVPAREYLTYLDDYVVPQLKGWMCGYDF